MKNTAEPDAEPHAKANRRIRWITGAAGAAIALVGFAVVLSKSVSSKRDDGGEGWSKEGADWFNNLPWEDALYLLTRQEDDVRAEEDEQRLGRLRQGYESATGHTWD